MRISSDVFIGTEWFKLDGNNTKPPGIALKFAVRAFILSMLSKSNAIPQSSHFEKIIGVSFVSVK